MEGAPARKDDNTNFTCLIFLLFELEKTQEQSWLLHASISSAIN